MLFRKIVLASATLAALLPAICNASTEKASLQACASAFATSLAASGAPAPTFKLDYLDQDQPPVAWTSYHPMEYSFTMEAHDAKSGAAIARARCSANSRGVVKDMATLPLNKSTAATTLAAR
jgi:hypothetical protein